MIYFCVVLLLPLETVNILPRRHLEAPSMPQDLIRNYSYELMPQLTTILRLFNQNNIVDSIRDLELSKKHPNC